MDLTSLKSVIPYNIAIYQFGITFFLSGASKLVDSKPLEQMFPALPKWFWKVAGVYELMLLGTYFYGPKEIALYMSTIYLGGVVFASAILRDAKKSTMVLNSFGLILLPPIGTFLP